MNEKSNSLICPSCDAENLPGTLFCVQCGTYLPSGGPLRTEPFPEQEQPRPRPWKRDAEDQRGQALHLELEILSSGRKITLSRGSDILIGRLDAAHGIFPEVDFTADGGLEHGVSRRQARIYIREGECYIEDLDSTNGTYLNDERLTPYLPYKVHDEDLLRFGTLATRVHIYES
jgi:pSer/pThr/pTyr-binding forkhead associated (FHA) protein